MYRSTRAIDFADSFGLSNCDGLGLSIRPPSWLRNIVATAAKGGSVTVNTPLGPATIPLDDPSKAKEILATIKQRITTPTPGEVVNAAVTSPNLPLVLGFVGLGLLALMFMRKR